LEQYVRIEYYGYKNTILNLSKIDIKPDEIKRFIERNKVLAVSVPSERLNKGDIIKMLKETNTSVYRYSEGKLEEADK
jgi:hypothetical protein